MNPDLDTLTTRLYVTIDDLLIDHPEWAPERPAVGIAPRLSDAELLTLSVLQALLGYTSEARFIRHAHAHPAPLARACPSSNNDLWLVDSTPVGCGRSRETAKRSDLAGWATYGYCSSHSRFFWDSACTSSPHPQGSPSRTRLPARRPTNATPPWT